MGKPSDDLSAQSVDIYNTAAIRELLRHAFTDKQLRRFCYDRLQFRPVTRAIGSESGLEDIIDELIKYCDVYLLFDELLEAVKAENPRQFARFESHLRASSASREVSVRRRSWLTARPFVLGTLPFIILLGLAVWWLFMDRTSAIAHLARGNGLLGDGAYENAIIEYDKAIEKDPENVAAIVNSAVAYYHLGQFPEAIRRYQEALVFSPKDADIYVGLGAANIQLDEWVVAEVYYEQAIEIAPDLSEAWFGKARVAQEMGDMVEAVSAFWRFTKLESQKPRVGRDDEAMAIAEEYLSNWSVIHTVQHGDTISGIALLYDVTEDAIIAANYLQDPRDFQVGADLVIPLDRQAQPTETPLPFDPPSSEAPQLSISEILGIGQAEKEHVVITNAGERLVDMEGWTLSDVGGNVYTLPNFRLWPGGNVTVHTGIGQNGFPPNNFYWGKLDAIWTFGDVLILRDTGGSIVATELVAP